MMKTTTISPSKKDSIWYEKHRPKKLKQLTLPKKHEIAFKSYIEKGDFPHLLFFGPPGSGKTTVAYILMDDIDCQRMELNASSNDRGVDVAKGKVKSFASSKSPVKERLKVIFLDEADGLTGAAQDALRNTMERYAHNAKFILTANNPNKIDDAIRSRCTQIEFIKFPKPRLLKLLIKILEKEEVSYQKKDIKKLIERFYPDTRTIINNLQYGSIGGDFNLKTILPIGSDPAKLCGFLKDGQMKKMRMAWAGTMDFLWFYKYLFDEYLFELPEDLRADVATTIAEFMYKDAMVIDKEINMTACCLEIMELLEVEITF